MAIEYSDEAIDDLEQIDRYTTETWSERQAIQYLSKLRRVILQLEQFPQLGRVLSDIELEARLIRAEEHLVVYLPIDNGVIRIIRVLHKNRELDAALRLS